MAFLVRQGDYASALQIYSYVGNTDDVASALGSAWGFDDLTTKDVDVFGADTFFWFSSQLAHDVTREISMKTAVI